MSRGESITNNEGSTRVHCKVCGFKLPSDWLTTNPDAPLCAPCARLVEANGGGDTEQPDLWSGWALADRGAVLAALAATGVPPVHPVLDCEHITYAYPDVKPAPEARAVRLLGVAADDRIQALVAEVDGTILRPDGRLYHITYSFCEGAEPVESNDLLARNDLLGRPRAITLLPRGPIVVAVTPFLRNVVTP